MTHEEKFARLLADQSPRLRDAFLGAIREITDDVILNQLVEMIERGDVNGAFRALGISQPVFGRLSTLMAQTFEQGALLIMSTYPRHVREPDGLKVPLRFNMRDRDAEQWLRDQSSSLVTRITEETRSTVRTTLETGLTEGRNPRSVALDIVGRLNTGTGHREGGVVGLSEQGELWSRRVRQKLEALDESYFESELRDKRFDRTVAKAIRNGEPLTKETVDKLVDRYRSNALRHRGEMIGRTEALAALNRSEYFATLQAVQSDPTLARFATKEWDSTGDMRVRPSHIALDGQKVGLNEAFVSPVTGARLLHPGDTSLGASGGDVIACRCRVKYRVDFVGAEKARASAHG